MHAINFLQICYGFHCCVENGYDQLDLCQPWNDNQWPVLPRCLTLSRQMLPAIKHVAGGTFVFQQHNASSHRAKNTIKLLQQEMPDFIGPDLWPLNNPDLSPVDYKVWGVVPQRVYECHMNSVDELKQCLVEVLNSLR